jgi:hypothetical protein
MTGQRRGESHHHPHGEHPAGRLQQPRMPGQPRRPARAPAGVNPVPCGRPAGPAGKHVIHMHHELLVRKLLLASLVNDSLIELLAIRRARVTLRTPRLRRWDRCKLGLRLAEPIGCSRCGWRIEDLCCRLSGKAWLTWPACSPRRVWSIRLRQASLRQPARRWRRRVALSPGCVGGLLHRAHSGVRDVKRHHPVASEVVAGGRLLSDDQPHQLGLAAKRTLQAGAQAGTTDGLRGVPGRPPHILADHQPPRGAASTGGLRPPGYLRWRCRSVCHRGY